jgi:hypothetical protein
VARLPWTALALLPPHGRCSHPCISFTVCIPAKLAAPQRFTSQPAPGKCSCPKLTRLNLSCCMRLTDESIVLAPSLPHPHPNPQLPSVPHPPCGRRVAPPRTSHRSAPVRVQLTLSERLTALTHLNLRCCARVTDVGVVAVARRCTGLTDLNLSCCASLTDRTLDALARLHCERLPLGSLPLDARTHS